MEGDFMEENIKVLDELNKGACMGEDAINFVLDKAEDTNFKDLLRKQYKKYEEISLKINDIYNKYKEDDSPQETSKMNKVMTWYGIGWKTISDNSTSKLAELLLQGTNMGIIEGVKILNHKVMDSEVKKIAKKFVEMQENSVEELKGYL